MLYFAYGSNMSEEKMKSIFVRYNIKTKATLKGYKLCFNKISKKDNRVGFANIMVDGNSIVEGVLYNIFDVDLKNLDKCEGYPNHYLKKNVDVILESGEKLNALTYVAVGNKVNENLKPTQEYLSKLLDGKKYLSEEYFEKLKRTEIL